MGHGMLSAGCMPSLMKQFVESASTTELDTSCLTIQKPDPFFINFVTPPP